MNALPGIGGSLFPSQFIADGLDESLAGTQAPDLERERRRLCSWWDRLAATCGPATGIRALFDLVAMPLAGMLGFRARDAEFAGARGTVRLETASGTSVGLMILPWASRPSLVWRDLAGIARRFDARWNLVVAPPFVSVVPASGYGIRRSIDFRLPDALDIRAFARFRLICRASAFERVLPLDPLCPIDRLVAQGISFQDRVRTDLQKGVVDALAALAGALDRRAAAAAADASFSEALTLVYRILFLLFAESRNLVPLGHVDGRAYSIGALCRGVLAGESHTGLWDGLAAITRLSRAGCDTDDLIVRPFNGRLFARAAAPSLESQRITRLPTRASRTRDAAVGRALLSLASRSSRAGRTAIAYSDLGVEQLGAVYERVLDLNLDLRQGRSPAEAAGGRSRRGGGRHSARRKETGTFYTPQPLAEFVVRRTLAPLVAGATPDRILALRVVDPAMGSGAFLVAACRYLAAAYERALIDEGHAAATDFDEDRRAASRRLIAERCLAGVDANPLAVQLARLSLWLATLARGKPLGFLDHRLRVGNSLLGASPDDLARIAPLGRRRFDPSLRLPLFETADLEQVMKQVSRPLAELAYRPDDTVRDVRAKETIWDRLCGTRSPLAPWRLACSLWCARWFWPSRPPSPAETRAAIDALLRKDRTLDGPRLAGWIHGARSIADDHQFFHWPLEFADVFYDETGAPKPVSGFDAVIGNPPWEMLRNDGGDARAGAAAVVRFIRESGLFGACGHGHLNLYQPFLERALTLAHGAGRVGLILPWGLAADDGAAILRRTLIDRSRVHTIVGLDNAAAIFPVHRGLRFLVLVASPGGTTGEIRARFGVRTVEEIDDLPAREESVEPTAYPIRLTPRLLASVGGSALRIPDARDPSQLALLQQLMARFPRLGSADGWAAEFGRELNATEDRIAFGTNGLPIIEGKHVSPFEVRTSAQAHRIERDRARERLPGRPYERARLAYRDVSAVTNRVSLIAAVVPPDVVTTHTLLCLRTPVPLVRQHFLCALFNSYVLNAVVRMLMGGHVTTTLVESLPVPVWTGDRLQRRIASAARLLSRGSRTPGAQHADLQASIARLYALDSQTFRDLLETFPLIPRQDRDRALETFRAS